MNTAAHAALPIRHLLLAVAVVAVWGSNFVVIKLGLGHLPPLLFATLRFAFALFPAALFIRRPAVPWRDLALYGVLIGAGQFGLLFLAMRHDISPGLASLVIQTQVFFTIGMAMRLHRERIQLVQVVALALAVLGIGVIAAHAKAQGGAVATPLGLALVLVAAACWAGGNLVARRAGKVDMLGYVVWSCLFAVPPLLVMSLLFEGPSAMVQGVRDMGWSTWAVVLWQSVGNSLFGYAAWGWLLARHPAATITPMALLVPVFGMGASAWFLGEPLPAWKLAAAALVMAGLALNVLWPRWRAARLAAVQEAA